MSDELIERLRAELGLPISELRNIHAAAEAVNLAFDRYNDEDEKKLRGEPHDMSYAQHEIDRATAKYEEVAFTRSVQSLGLEVCLSRLEKAAARITALEEENKRLREALEPFAEAAQGLDPSDKDGWLMWEHPQANAVSVGDFRRAAAALEPRG